MHSGLTTLAALPKEFTSSMDENQEAALKEALDVHAQSLRQWLEQHEEVAVQLWPQNEEQVLDDAELQDLDNPAFAAHLRTLEIAKANHSELRKEATSWRQDEQLISRAQGNTPMRRLRGKASGTLPLQVSQQSVVINFGSSTENDGRKRNTHVIGCPELLQTSGVLYYEVVVDAALPDNGYVFGKTEFGFAARDFEHADKDEEFYILESKRIFTDFEEPATSWKAHVLDLDVGGVYGFAANMELGQLAFCKAGSWDDPDSRVLVVDSRICKGVYPLLTAPWGSVTFRPPAQCTSSKPPPQFWERQMQFKAAFRAGDEEVATALAIEEIEHEMLEHVSTGSPDQLDRIKALTTGADAGLSPSAQDMAWLVATELGGVMDAELPHSACAALAAQALDKIGPSKLGAHTELLTSRVAHSSSTVRRCALRRLTALEPELLSTHTSRIIPRVIERLEDPDGGTRAAAVEVVCQLSGSLQEAHRAEIIKFVEKPSLHARHSALKVMENSPAMSDLHAAVRSLCDPAAIVRIAALGVIKHAAGALSEQHVGDVIKLLQHKVADVKHTALAALAAFEPSIIAARVVTPVLELLSSPVCDRMMRKLAFDVLMKLERGLHLPASNISALLTHDESSVRKSTLKLLTAKLEPSQLSQYATLVASCIAHDAPSVQTAAVATCKQLEISSLNLKALTSLSRLLNHDIARVRDQAVAAFLQFGPALGQHVGILLLPLLSADGSAAARDAALRAMAKLEAPTLAESTAQWVPCINDADSSVRSAALDLLAKLDAAARVKYVELVVARIADTPTAAQKALLKFGPAELEPHAAAIAKHSTHQDLAVRHTVLNGLARLPPEELEKYASRVIDSLEDDEQQVRSAAQEALGKMHPTALQQHGSALASRLDHRLAVVRKAVLGALAKLSPAALRDHSASLVKRLADADKDVQSQAESALRRLRPSVRVSHVADILRLLGHSDPRVRSVALQAINLLSGATGRAALSAHVDQMASFLDVDDLDVQVTALKALQVLGSAALERLVPRLRALLEGGESSVRTEVLNVMACLRPSTLQHEARLVMRSLHDDAEQVRAAAIGALRAFGMAARAQQVVALLPTLTDSKAALRVTGLKALRLMEPLALQNHCGRIMRAATDASAQVREAAVDVLARKELLQQLDKTALSELLSEFDLLFAHEKKEVKMLTFRFLRVFSRSTLQSRLTRFTSLLGNMEVNDSEYLTSVYHELGIRRRHYKVTELPPNIDLVLRAADAYLIKCCEQSKSFDQRAAAVGILGCTGVSARQHVSQVLKRLSDVDEDVRACALKAMRRLGSFELKKHLAQAMRLVVNDPHPTSRTAAVNVLGELDLASFIPLLPKLCEQLQKETNNSVLHRLRKVIAAKLGPARLKTHVTLFLPMLSRTDAPASQTAVLQLLGKLEPDALREVLHHVAKLVESPTTEGKVANTAITTIAKAGFPECEALIVKQLDVEARQGAALIAMQKMEPSALVHHSDKLIELLQESSVTKAAVETLCKLGIRLSERVDSSLVPLLSHGDSYVRVAALQVMAKLPASVLTPLKVSLFKCLEDGNAEVVAAAFDAVAALHKEDVVAFEARIVEELEDVSDAVPIGAALAAVAALPRTPAPRASHLATLWAHMSSRNSNVSGPALKAFTSLTPAELAFCASLLAKSLLEGDQAQRAQAAVALGKLRGVNELVVPVPPEADE